MNNRAGSDPLAWEYSSDWGLALSFAIGIITILSSLLVWYVKENRRLNKLIYQIVVEDRVKREEWITKLVTISEKVCTTLATMKEFCARRS